MKTVEVHTLRAFTKENQGGNPAGVVLNAEHMGEADMQQTARVLGFSETAFIQSSACADWKIRFFTPNDEVDVCGHATIAAFSLLKAQQIAECGMHTMETKAGVLEVEVREDGLVFLTQTLPHFAEQVDRRHIAASLRLQPEDLMEDLPVQIVSTGLRDILVPVRSLAVLQSIEPDMTQITEMSKAYGAVGYHVFALDTDTGAVARCRNFAPLYDIPEESATGTATGALSSYLYEYGKIAAEQAHSLVFEQGYTMHCPSEIRVKLHTDPRGRIASVQVGGRTSTAEVRRIILPLNLAE
ncbi:PhzF family phenazine biosynthesis protein [Aneurinibacillus sp. BA2021]|nr:PhzF family phenazine biosynthesis protein [Aneurinibacillus sp. BA2021]